MANLEQFPSAALNGAYYDTPVAFEPQLPHGPSRGHQPLRRQRHRGASGAVLLEGGKLRLNFLAPTAAKVDAVLRYRERHDLEKGENGLWTAEIDAGDGGFIPILFHVDGVEVLNPLAPVGYGSSRPINYVDVPQPGVDFYLCKDVPHGTVTQELLLCPVCRPAEKLPGLHPCRLHEGRYPNLPGALPPARPRGKREVLGPPGPGQLHFG